MYLPIDHGCAVPCVDVPLSETETDFDLSNTSTCIEVKNRSLRKPFFRWITLTTAHYGAAPPSTKLTLTYLRRDARISSLAQ